VDVPCPRNRGPRAPDRRRCLRMRRADAVLGRGGKRERRPRPEGTADPEQESANLGMRCFPCRLEPRPDGDSRKTEEQGMG
jgi:hypothetical protein